MVPSLVLAAPRSFQSPMAYLYQMCASQKMGTNGFHCFNKIPSASCAPLVAKPTLARARYPTANVSALLYPRTYSGQEGDPDVQARRERLLKDGGVEAKVVALTSNGAKICLTNDSGNAYRIRVHLLVVTSL